MNRPAASSPARAPRQIKIDWIANGLALVFFATYAGWKLHLNLAAAGFLDLAAVLTVAMRGGFWEATVVSIFANATLNYFFVPPIFNLSVADPQNWVALGVFEFAALLVSRLSIRARQESDRATRHEDELQLLYDVARQLLLMDREAVGAADIALFISRAVSLESVALFDASGPKCHTVGSAAFLWQTSSRHAYLTNRDTVDLETGTRSFVLRLGIRPIGALTVGATHLTDVTLKALASLAAVALERGNSFVRESQAHAEKKVERLRTAVLDSLAHDFKTPLTVIRTATTGLMEMGQLNASQTELLIMIDEQSTFLSDLTTRLLQTSRLKADVRLRREMVSVNELIDDAVKRCGPALSGHPVEIRGSEDSVVVRADKQMCVTALAQFLDNAGKYSRPGSPIVVSVGRHPAEIHIAVHNEGSPIAPEDRQSIFQRFYRSSTTSHKASGTGIGLSISKQIADAHQGRVWVTSDEGSGTTFYFALPYSEKEQV